MDPFVSVIIITKDREEELELSLKSILKQKYSYFEVIIVNNGRKTQRFLKISKLSDKIRVIQNSHNLGACVPRNQGLKIAKGKYIWFLDDDIELLHDDYFTLLVTLMENDPNIASIGGEIVTENGNVFARYAHIMKTGRTNIQKTIIKEDQQIKFKGFLPTCNCFIRIEDLQKIGGFYPGYFFGSEDKDIGYRILKLRRYHFITKKTLLLHKITNKGFQRNPFVSNFLVNKNRTCFCVRNFKLKNAIKVPLLDFAYLFSKGNSIRKFLEIPFIIAAYFWNIIFISQTLKSKNKKYI